MTLEERELVAELGECLVNGIMRSWERDEAAVEVIMEDAERIIDRLRELQND